MKKIIMTSCFVFLCGALITANIFIIKNRGNSAAETGEVYKGLPVGRSHAVYAYDMSTPTKAISVSDYTFVCRVNKVLRTEYRDPVEAEQQDGSMKIVTDPYTVYSVTVIQNIKGNLIEDAPIELVQYGGITEDGSAYNLMLDTELLKENAYYILLPLASSEDGELLIMAPYDIIYLGDDISEKGALKFKAADAPEKEVIEAKTVDVLEKEVLKTDFVNEYTAAYDPDLIATSTTGEKKESFQSKYDKKNYSIK